MSKTTPGRPVGDDVAAETTPGARPAQPYDPNDPIVEGLTPRDVFMAHRQITIDTFYRWKRRGLPVMNVGLHPYVITGAPYPEEQRATAWFRNGMKPLQAPPAPKLRRVARRRKTREEAP